MDRDDDGLFCHMVGLPLEWPEPPFPEVPGTGYVTPGFLSPDNWHSATRQPYSLSRIPKSDKPQPCTAYITPRLDLEF